MTVARSVADVVAEHVRFEVACIDRMYCNVYVPHLQYAGAVSGLALGDPHSQALLHALEVFRLTLPDGFWNADLRQLMGQLRALPEGAVTAGQMTYDLRRLRAHRLVQRVPHTNRYRITDFGLHVALLITRVQERVLPTGLGHLLAPGATTTRLAAAARAYEVAVDELIRQQLAA